jgi:hypothetical protein
MAEVTNTPDCPVDLPSGVLGELLREGVSAHQSLMTESKGNIQHSNNMLRSMANKKFDEVGSVESRAVDRVLSGGNA